MNHSCIWEWSKSRKKFLLYTVVVEVKIQPLLSDFFIFLTPPPFPWSRVHLYRYIGGFAFRAHLYIDTRIYSSVQEYWHTVARHHFHLSLIRAPKNSFSYILSWERPKYNLRLQISSFFILPHSVECPDRIHDPFVCPYSYTEDFTFCAYPYVDNWTVQASILFVTWEAAMLFMCSWSSPRK